MTDNPLDPIETFIEQMGFISQAEGGPRIAGRIFGLLLVEGSPLTLQEMADRLQISKASASTNARLLARYGAIRRRSRSGDRQDYYEVVPDPNQHMLDMVEARMRRNADDLEQTERLFPDGVKAKERIHKLVRFYRVSADFLREWSGRWHDDLSPEPPGSGDKS